ncbi:hypothetical protein, partial [Enterococcus faecium]|uniref:hypothetical protein n=1 Tax=Enterococcus faecium TaxID=1352 RepID=UPI003DA54DF9
MGQLEGQEIIDRPAQRKGRALWLLDVYRAQGEKASSQALPHQRSLADGQTIRRSHFRSTGAVINLKYNNYDYYKTAVRQNFFSATLNPFSFMITLNKLTKELHDEMMRRDEINEQTSPRAMSIRISRDWRRMDACHLSRPPLHLTQEFVDAQHADDACP